jgi:1-acyl-sn-glycerol-3-phosphate acyltransferase
MSAVACAQEIEPMILSLIKFLARPLFKVLFALEHHGASNVPTDGPVILAGNHPSYLDPLLVALPLKRTIRFMAWDALFKVPLLGGVIKAMGAFPVDLRKGKGESAYREACSVLERGEALGIFPEGQRSERGPMGELRAGVARLAIATGAPIVPITIGGASRAWPKWRLLPKPAKIVVRYHAPIRLDEAERAARGDDRGYQQEIMQRVAASINRSLTPALRGAANLERWYRQPPSNIRSYEWAPLLAGLIATLIAQQWQRLGAHWLSIWLPLLAYHLYLIADLLVIKPGRSAKWLRNSMPLWLIFGWHYPLTRALDVPAGEMNVWLAGAVLAVFFPFFWEDYYRLQKFVRGLVVVYYFSLALLLGWPHALGTFVAVLSFILVFSLRYRTRFYALTLALMLLLLALAVVLTGSASLPLLAYVALAAATLGYLQTFATIAYDIRQAGEVSVQNSKEAAPPGSAGDR